MPLVSHSSSSASSLVCVSLNMSVILLKKWELAIEVVNKVVVRVSSFVFVIGATVTAGANSAGFSALHREPILKLLELILLIHCHLRASRAEYGRSAARCRPASTPRR